MYTVSSPDVFGTVPQCAREQISRLARTRQPAPGHTAVSRSDRCHSGSRRTTPPLQPHRRVAVGPRSQLQAVVPPLPSTVLYCAELLPLSAVSRPLSRLRRGLTRASHANKLVAMLLNRVADMVERHAVASILVVQERHSHARSISKNCATPQSAAGLRVLLVLRWCRVTSAFWITSGRRFPLNLRDVHFGQGWPQQRPFKNGHPLFSRWRFVFR